MTHYRITHTTTYTYSEPVSLCQNVAHLAPRPCHRQRAGRTVLTITPDPAVIEERVDYFGNPVSYFTIQEPHRELAVGVSHRLAVRPDPPPATTPAWEAVRDRLTHDRSAVWLDAYQFAFDSRFAPEPQYGRPSQVPSTARRSRSANSLNPVIPTNSSSLPNIPSSSRSAASR